MAEFAPLQRIETANNHSAPVGIAHAALEVILTRTRQCGADGLEEFTARVLQRQARNIGSPDFFGHHVHAIENEFADQRGMANCELASNPHAGVVGEHVNRPRATISELAQCGIHRRSIIGDGHDALGSVRESLPRRIEGQHNPVAAHFSDQRSELAGRER